MAAIQQHKQHRSHHVIFIVIATYGSSALAATEIYGEYRTEACAAWGGGGGPTRTPPICVTMKKGHILLDPNAKGFIKGL